MTTKVTQNKPGMYTEESSHTKTENKMVNIIHNKCISCDETKPLLDVLFTSKLVYQQNNIKNLVY